MATTKSKSPRKGKDTVQDAPTEQVNEGATLASENKRTTNMSESSIIEFSEDIANAEAPVPLPAGDYTAEIRAAEVKTSGKGNEYFAVTFFIPPEQYPADYTDGDPDGTTLGYNRLQKRDDTSGRYRVRKFCEAIGAKMGKKIDVNEWIGLTATVAVDNSEWEGEPRAEIKKVVAP
jgi:hypothetical protein